MTVLKSFKFPVITRFVRIVIPPYDKKLKQGEELPDYKFELFTCSDTGKVKGRKRSNLGES